MNRHKIDILCLQETKSKKIPSLDRFIHFQKEGYVVKYIQGGLGIIIKGFLQEFCIEKRHNNRDIMFIKCMGINIFNCYGRNDQTNMKIFINDIKEITEKFNFEKTIILGDFNLEDYQIKKIITGSNYHLIKNEKNSRTRNIDHIITNFKKFNYDNIINSTTQIHPDITDHKLISNKFLFNKDKDIITNYSIKKTTNNKVEIFNEINKLNSDPQVTNLLKRNSIKKWNELIYTINYECEKNLNFWTKTKVMYNNNYKKIFKDNDQMEKEYNQVVKKATLEINQDVIKIIENYKIEYENKFIDINQIFSVEKIINQIKLMKEKAVLDFDKIYHYKNTSNIITEEYLSFIQTIKMIFDRWLNNFDLPILNFIKKKIYYIHSQKG
ncbi:abc transporter i family member 6 [Anaeramoeba flamelloides]|uniref:Abc transporter i family member 6 n=1 Tax=Anaeramoeba flamelloides TaxID=1746091 RepID=A0AAV8ADD6_9EUKA|nr:abc transporter i family member 6 [Anaeramoeba flamelloides]